MVILWEHGGNALGKLQEQRGNGMGTSEDSYGNIDYRMRPEGNKYRFGDQK